MHLREATDAEKRARDAVTHEAWGATLSVAQFEAREVLLRGHPWCREVMTTWLWLDETGQVLSSCETFRCPSNVGEVPGVTFAVARVFTEKRLRGRGHAAAMFEALVARLRTEPQAQASVLYSDVGAALYERSGYRAVPAFDVVFTASELPAPGVTLCAAPPARREVATALGVTLDGAPPPRRVAPSTPGALTMTPSDAQLEWHLLRERYYAERRGRPALPVHGAVVGGASIAFAADFRHDALHVLWLDADAPGEAAVLIAAAQAQAHLAGLPQVRAWEVPALAGLPGGQLEARDGSLPMVVAFAAGLTEWTAVQKGLWV